MSVPRLSDEKDPEPVGVDKLWDGRISRGLSGAPLRLGEDPGVELGPVDAAILVLATAPRKGRASALVIGQALDMGKATHAVVVVVVVVRGEPLSKLFFCPSTLLTRVLKDLILFGWHLQEARRFLLCRIRSSKTTDSFGVT